MNEDLGRLVSLIKNFAFDFGATYMPRHYLAGVRKWTAYGPKPSETQLLQWETAVAKNPWDLKSRAKLILRYSQLSRENEIAQRKHAQHILWVATNRPEHPVAYAPWFRIASPFRQDDYQKIKSVWLQQIKGKANIKNLFANAANFLQDDADHALVAEDAFLQAVKCDSKNVELRSQLSRLYSNWPGHEDAAFRVLDEICNGEIPEAYFFDLKDLPSRAFAAGHYNRAVDTAQQLLVLSRKQYRDTNVEHQAHTVIGRVALQRGDQETACKCLQKSIENAEAIFFTRPNLALVNDLIEVGEKKSPIEFLDKLELLLGFDDESLFEVRFRIETGLQRSTANFDLDEQFYESFFAYKLSHYQNGNFDLSRVTHEAQQSRNRSERYEATALEHRPSTEEVTVHLQKLAALHQTHAINLEALLQHTDKQTEPNSDSSLQ